MDRLPNNRPSTPPAATAPAAPVAQTWRQRFTPAEADAVLAKLGREGEVFLNTDQRKTEFLNFICRGPRDDNTIRERFYKFRADIISQASVSDIQDMTPAMRAVQMGDRAELARLVRQNPALLIQPCLRPRSPDTDALLATLNGPRAGEDIATAILHVGHHPFVGMNALTLAVARDPSGEMMNFICQTLAPENQHLLNATDGQGNTPLTFAVDQDHVECVKTLIARGARIDAPNARQSTALMLAAGQCNPTLVAICLNNGASVLGEDIDNMDKKNAFVSSVLNMNSSNKENGISCLKLMAEYIPAEFAKLCDFSDFGSDRALSRLSNMFQTLTNAARDPEAKTITSTCILHCLELACQSTEFYRSHTWAAVGESFVNSHPQEPGLQKAATDAVCTMINRVPTEFAHSLSTNVCGQSELGRVCKLLTSGLNTPAIDGARATCANECLKVACNFPNHSWALNELCHGLFSIDRRRTREENEARQAHAAQALATVIVPWVSEQINQIKSNAKAGASPDDKAKSLYQTINSVVSFLNISNTQNSPPGLEVLQSIKNYYQSLDFETRNAFYKSYMYAPAAQFLFMDSHS